MKEHTRAIEEIEKGEDEIDRLRAALERAAERFERPEFGCEWQDAAEDCRRALEGGADD